MRSTKFIPSSGKVKAQNNESAYAETRFVQFPDMLKGRLPLSWFLDKFRVLNLPLRPRVEGAGPSRALLLRSLISMQS